MSLTARAALMTGVGEPLVLTDVALDDPGPHEVLIEVRASGVCHTDHTAWTGGMPAWSEGPVVLGHEVAGVVTQVGSAVGRVQVGDHVVTCAAAFCGHCAMCQRGLQQHCTAATRDRSADAPPRLTTEGMAVRGLFGLGGFASSILVSEQTVAPIPAEMPFDRASLLGCAVHTGIGAVRHTARVTSGDRVVVIGCGGVGLNVVHAARAAGASRIVAVDVNAAKLRRAQDFGATDLVDAAEQDPVAAVLDLVPGGVDHAFEVVGRGDTIVQAFSMLRSAGTATVVGVARAGEMVSIPATALLTEKRLQGSKMGQSFLHDIDWYCEEYLAGRLPLDELVSTTISLEEINECLSGLESADTARTVITFP